MKIDLLAIVAHPDDAELCCSGTLLKHQKLGYKVGIIDLTAGELGSRGTKTTRKQEAENSSKILNLSYRKNLDLGDGAFINNFETRLPIIEQIRKCKPEIIITNAITDRHPDHGRAAKLVSDACFFSGLLKIETQLEGKNQEHWRPKQVWHCIQDYHIEPDIVVNITEHWKQKIDSILAFKTQFHTGETEQKEIQTPISSKDFFDFLEARARTLGRPIGATYAEGFTKSKYIGVQNLFDLV